MTPCTEHAEAILPAHPDKLCDAVVDAIVDRVQQADPLGKAGLEAACTFHHLVLTGRVAVQDPAALDGVTGEALADLVRQVYRDAGYGPDAAGFAWDPAPGGLRITDLRRLGAFDPGEREVRAFSDDQAVCVGYASADPATDHLPPAAWLSRRIARELFRLRREKGAGQVGPDGKVLARVVRDGAAWRPLHVSISLNHHEGSDWILLNRLAEEALEKACAGLPLPDLELNGAGEFTCSGPMGDNGLSGKKLAVDAYGPAVPVGGGARSGKDFNKVDRIGGLLARRLALAAVAEGDAREALVTLAYIPGCTAPVDVRVRLDGRETALEALPLTAALPRGNAVCAGLFRQGTLPLSDLARWGHFRPGLPWESGLNDR
jgi:S-adenosylmethionine synthetase